MDILRETIVGALSALGGLLAGWFGKIFPSYSDLLAQNNSQREEIVRLLEAEKKLRSEHAGEVDTLREKVAGLEDALRDSEER